MTSAASVSEDVAEKYCDCSAEKILKKYSIQEVKEFEKIQNDPEVQQKLADVLQPCLDELQANLGLGGEAMEMDITEDISPEEAQ